MIVAADREVFKGGGYRAVSPSYRTVGVDSGGQGGVYHVEYGIIYWSSVHIGDVGRWRRAVTCWEVAVGRSAGESSAERRCVGHAGTGAEGLRSARLKCDWRG